MLALFLNLNSFHAALYCFNQEYNPYLPLAVVQVKELLLAFCEPYLHNTPVRQMQSHLIYHIIGFQKHFIS